MNSLVKSVQFQLTTSCNERCIFCRKYTWKKRELPIEIIEKKMNKYKNAFYQFSGGEPTMYSNLSMLNKLLEGKKYKVYTNGVVDLANEEVLKFLDNAVEIAISFDACNSKTYNKVRRPLDDFAFYKVIATATRYSTKSKLSMVVTSENIEEIPGILITADSIGIKTRFYPIHTNTDGLIPSKKQVEDLKKELENMEFDKELTNVFGIFDVGFFDTKRDFIPCKARKYSRLIDEQGREYFCCYAINDNGMDIDGVNSIDKLKYFDTTTMYGYCDHCTRYRNFNENEVEPGPKFM